MDRKIIGICGLIGSGKGTVADILVSEYNFTKLSFADRLKDSVAVLFGWPRNLLEGDTAEGRHWREQPDQFWSQETQRTITPRLVLQEFGTECMRNGFYDGIWVSLVKKTIQENPSTNFVLPDTRFPNEVETLQQIGGEVWWVHRGTTPDWFLNYRIHGIQPKGIHPSEWSWAGTKFDNVIDNNGSLDQLKSQALASLK
jgi:hypothetical protein